VPNHGMAGAEAKRYNQVLPMIMSMTYLRHAIPDPGEKMQMLLSGSNRAFKGGRVTLISNIRLTATA
jgi:hypothetical protein